MDNYPHYQNASGGEASQPSRVSGVLIAVMVIIAALVQIGVGIAVYHYVSDDSPKHSMEYYRNRLDELNRQQEDLDKIQEYLDKRK